MGDVVQEVIYNEGVPYLTKETIDYILNIAKSFLPKIENWIVQANNFVNHSSRKQWSNKYIFTNSEGNIAKGINWAGNNTRQYLSSQLKGHAQHIKSTSDQSFTDEYSMERLLKEGYRILTEFGETIRKDKVKYRLYVYSGNADLGINDVQEFELSLDQLLGRGTIVTSTGELRVASKTQLNEAFKNDGKLTNLSFDLDELNTFIKELKGYFLFAGRDKKDHKLEKEGQQLEQKKETVVKTINLGHVFETALNYPDVFIRFKGLTEDIKSSLDWIQVTEAEKYWQSFDEKALPTKANVELNLHKIARIFQTLQDPSPFWQGGEGDNLQNIQVKVGQAKVTNLSTLIRQMLRVRSIISGISRINAEGKITRHIAKREYEERIVAGLLRMFDRRFTGRYQWNINF